MPVVTGLEEPTGSRGPTRSKYDVLLEEGVGEWVALIRGEAFGEQVQHRSIRSALYQWGRSRGVEVHARISWDHPQTGEPSPFRDEEGEPLPYAMLVKVVSPDGNGPPSRAGKGRGRPRTRRRRS